MYPFAIAAYNGGPYNVDRWIQKYSPSETQHGMIDWIESIPFRETRYYVLKVMERDIVYRYLIYRGLTESVGSY